MARLPEVVVDASVVCKWFVPEAGSEGALDLREAHIEGRVRVLAPDLLAYELANALRHHPSMSTDRIRTATRSLFDMQISLERPSSASWVRAADFAYREKLTIYDACYAVLAVGHSCPLVTDDSRHLRASKLAIPSSEWSRKA